VDGSGNAYVTAEPSLNFPTANRCRRRLGGSDAFVAKLNAAGTALVYSTYLGAARLTLATASPWMPPATLRRGLYRILQFPHGQPAAGTLGGGRTLLWRNLTRWHGAIYATYLGGSVLNTATASPWILPATPTSRA